MAVVAAARAYAVELVLVACLAASAGTTAWSFWSAPAAAGGSGAAAAAAVDQAATPTAAVVGSGSVKVGWGASTLTNGRAISGYRISRYDAATGASQPVANGCAGTVTALTCTENAVPDGQWRYSITPLVAADWRGPESLRSGAVTIGSGTLTLAKTVFGASPALPQNTTGTISGFHAAEAVSYTIDGTPTPGTTSAVAADGTATISALTIQDLPDGPHTVFATGTAPTTASQASIGILIDRLPPTVGAQLTPAANASGWNRTAPVMVALDAVDGTGSGIDSTRYTVDGTDPRSSGSAQSYTAPLSISTDTTIRFSATDLAGNSSAVGTQVVRIDTVAPASAITLTGVTGGAFASGGTIYFRGVASGSFALSDAVADGGSGPAAGTTSPLSGPAVGWSHAPSTVTAPAGGPYVSNVFSWSAGTTDAPTETVTALDVAGNPTATALTFSEDSAPPAGGTVDATGLGGTASRYSRSLALSVAFAKGTDAGAGLRASGAQLLRASASLSSATGTTNGSCGSFGAFTQIGADDPASPVADSVPADNRCYRYQYVVADNVGNQAVLTSPDVKVETAAPATLTPTAVAVTPLTGGGAQSVAGSTVFYNPAQSGSFTVEASASDATSGVANVGFPALGGFTGGGAATTPVTQTTYRTTYSWSANGVFPSPGAQTLPATNNAGAVAAAAGAFTVAKDATGPAGGSVDAVGLGGTGGRYSPSSTLSIALSPGSDAGAGLAAGGATLSRATAPLTSSNGVINGTCGTYGASVQLGASGPVSPVSDVVSPTAACYRYAYTVPDRVGNTTTFTSPDIKVDPTPPSAPTLAFSALTNSFATGTTVYYRPGATSGAFTVTATASDTGAGLASFAFPALGTGWTSVAGALGLNTYSWAAADPAVPSGAQNILALNNAGVASAPTALTATPDGGAPTGGSVSYPDGFTKATSAVVSFTQGSDFVSGLNTASGLLQRASAPLTGAACGTFSAFTTVTTNPTSPATNTGLLSGTCYQYRYAVSDRVGNQAFFTNANVLKIDAVGPTHAFTLSAPVSAFIASGKLYYRSSVAGSFRLVDTLTDGLSGPASVTFPAITAAGWTHAAETLSTPAGGPFTSSTFSWTATPTGPGTVTTTGLDNVGNSGSGALAFTSDTTAPNTGTITYPNALTGVASVPVSFTNGTDSGAGLNLASAFVQRDEATLNTATETCGAFPGTFATTVALVGGADTSVTTGRCYKYRVSIADNVGNVRITTGTNVTRVDVGGVFVSAIASQQAGGAAGNGLLELGDKLVFTYSTDLAPGSVPATLTGATLTRSTSSAARLTLPGLSSGSQSTGSALYFAGTSGTGTATFNATVALVNNGAATTVTVTVTSLSVTAGTLAASAGTLAFLPPTSVTNIGGSRTAAGTFSTASTFKLF